MTTDNKTLAVDVLAILDQAFNDAVADGFYEEAQEIHQARWAASDLIQALAGLADLYDTDEGCRSTPQYVAARSALARVKGESA